MRKIIYVTPKKKWAKNHPQHFTLDKKYKLFGKDNARYRTDIDLVLNFDATGGDIYMEAVPNENTVGGQLL